MAKPIKTIPVGGQDQAALIINQLSRKYNMTSDTQRHQLHVSNQRYAAYYDAQEGVVKLESIHPSTTKEEVEEFLRNFPPFF